MQILDKIMAMLADRGDVEMVIRVDSKNQRRSIEFMLCDFNGVQSRRLSRAIDEAALNASTNRIGYISQALDSMNEDFFQTQGKS